MDVIYAMFSMVILTAIVGVMTAYSRIKSAYAGEIDPRYFRLMSQYKVTDVVAKFGRNLDNLFEVPVLFYAAGVTALALSLNDQLFLLLAWLFVVLRIIHTIIHLTYNQPMHRFAPFILSFLCVVGMWIRLIILINK